MKKLNIKKLKLNKSTVNSMGTDQTKIIVGGKGGKTKGTGYAPCICNYTWMCCTQRGSGPNI